LEASDGAKDTLHILERINLDLLLQNSILPAKAKLPKEIEIPRVKVSGRLPTLQVNVSDTKYKALMRFIDIAIPKFGDKPTAQAVQPQGKAPPIFKLPSNFFGSDPIRGYQLDDGVDDDEKEEPGDKKFVDARANFASVKSFC